jgi:hypothetical protein
MVLLEEGGSAPTSFAERVADVNVNVNIHRRRRPLMRLAILAAAIALLVPAVLAPTGPALADPTATFTPGTAWTDS